VNSLVIVIEPSNESEQNSKLEIVKNDEKREENTKIKLGLCQSHSSYSFTSYEPNNTYNTASLDRKFTSSTISMVNLCQSQLYVNRPKTCQIQSSIRVRLLQEKIFDINLRRSASGFKTKRQNMQNETNLQQSFISNNQREMRNRNCKSLLDDARLNESDNSSTLSIKDLIKKFENQSMK
jgi:hypothetical protein